MEKQGSNKGQIQLAKTKTFTGKVLAKTDQKLIINNSCLFANKVRNEITTLQTHSL